VDVDYYTDADMAVRFQVLDTFENQNQWGWGEVLLASRPTVYKPRSAASGLKSFPE
jgi:DEAD/DEAH box helicase domain-containing protein